MITFKIRYFLAAAALFVIEVFIAIFSHGGFLRLYFGDYLVVILIYCSVRAVTRFSIPSTACGVLLFSFAVEISQYFHLIQHLGLESYKLAHLILGSQFEWGDLICYSAGIVTVLIAEKTNLITKLLGGTA